jgi:hypothetical protein
MKIIKDVYFHFKVYPLSRPAQDGKLTKHLPPGEGWDGGVIIKGKGKQ